MAVTAYCEIRSKEGLLPASLNPLLFIHVFIHSCPTLWPCGLSPARLLLPWHSPGKNTGVGWHFLLQGIFLTQGSNPSLLHLLQWQVGSLPLCHLGSIHSFIHSFMHKSSGTCHMSGAADEVGVFFPVGDPYPACLEGVGDEKGRKGRVGLGTSIRGRY